MIIIIYCDKILGVKTDLDIISLVEPSGVLVKLGQLVRLSRMREGFTQPELARKSGVPMATISRFERTGKAGSETVLRLLFALNLLDSLDAYLEERLRLARFPKSLVKTTHMPVQRVRHRKEA